MIHTATQILSKVYSEDGMDGDLQLAITLNPSKELIIKAINEARIEIVKECAEVAKSEWKQYNGHMAHIVDKQSILKLLDQIK